MELNELTKKIQELVPEIMELKFGCEIYRKGAVKQEIFVGDFGDKMSLVRKDSNGTYLPTIMPKPPESQEYTILGRDITLEDVLLAIEAQAAIKDMWTEDTTREYIGQLLGVKKRLDGVKWNLNKPLQDQEPNTIKLLNEIICANT